MTEDEITKEMLSKIHDIFSKYYNEESLNKLYEILDFDNTFRKVPDVNENIQEVVKDFNINDVSIDTCMRFLEIGLDIGFRTGAICIYDLMYMSTNFECDGCKEDR